MEIMEQKPRERLTSYAEPDLVKRIKRIAKQTERSESQVIEMLLRRGLGLPGGMSGEIR
jgi:hypothetical protein